MSENHMTALVAPIIGGPDTIGKAQVPELLSLRRACRIAGIAPETALKLTEKGEFPVIRRVGHRRYVPACAFTTWLQNVTAA